MKSFQRAMVVVLLAAFSMAGYASESPSPTLDTILQRVLERAKVESENDRNFKQLYSYTREKITEYRDNNGKLKKREDKISPHQPKPSAASCAFTKKNLSPKVQKDEPVSDTHSNVRGQAIRKNELLNEDLVKRFRFTLIGKETINGRPSFVVDFVPAKKNLPVHHFKDHFINKAAGRVWVDAEDYAIVKTDLHLTASVDVAWGLAGAVWKFHYGFDRARTDDGLWFTRDVNWHLEGREVVVNRVVDYHEKTTGLRKIGPVAAR